jgi:hypothetical protein
MDFANFKKDEEYSDESLDEMVTWTKEVLEEYINNEAFSSLTESRQDYASFIIQIFIDACYNYGLKKPGQWDLDIIEEVCLDIFPKKINAEIIYFEGIGPVLISFMQWCEHKGYLSGTEALCKSVQEFAKDIVKKAKDPGNWGIAKSIMMGGMENILNSDKYFNERTSWPTLAHKIGRNEPCPCDSEKKYKKCCLMIAVN